MSYNDDNSKPLILITGAGGNIGSRLAQALLANYRVVGLDRQAVQQPYPIFAVDLASADSIALALRQVRDACGDEIASVVHLAAFFHFEDEEHPLYEQVNVQGTRELLVQLQRSFRVGQFVYASTMLVHRACQPGQRIDETQPLEPRWAYPRSKARAEGAMWEARGAIPCVALRLAGVYDERAMVPSLAHQIARVYEREMQSHFYAGSLLVGQAMLHRDDMIASFRRTIEARDRLPAQTQLLIGEADAIGYEALQDELGYLIHGARDWPTLRLPKPVAAAGAWAQARMEPVVPDVLDDGEKPFIRPFMVELADDHYALDTRRARAEIGWEPRHRLKDVLPAMVAQLKADPLAWYAAHGMTPPAWMREGASVGTNPDALRTAHEALRRTEHGANRWAHFANMGLGTWLATQPWMVNVQEAPLRVAEQGLGMLLVVLAAMALSWRATWARWGCALIGAVVMAAPFLFWTGNAAAYLSDTLVGALLFGLRCA